MSQDLLPESAIRFGVAAEDWRAAVRAAGDALVAAGTTTDAYTDAMIEAVETLGPYIVVAPGFALAHARPSEAVKRTGLSWVTLAEPVEFGSKNNDPVTLVVGLAAFDHDEHLQVMSKLAGVLANQAKLAELKASTDPAEVRAALLG
ncbi:PTS sugar transporter subunit IIA [Gulosibacter macacae]|uniref:PTS sugar transporter subunit IIA n=1 Tax=Gulosibacter macacae TaxID=2488791 RepID=UPI00163A9B12|nr:PTS sugar transporter subunit IIA [Gulosibacter macacae]